MFTITNSVPETNCQNTFLSGTRWTELLSVFFRASNIIWYINATGIGILISSFCCGSSNYTHTVWHRSGQDYSFDRWSWAHQVLAPLARRRDNNWFPVLNWLWWTSRNYSILFRDVRYWKFRKCSMLISGGLSTTVCSEFVKFCYRGLE